MNYNLCDKNWQIQNNASKYDSGWYAETIETWIHLLSFYCFKDVCCVIDFSIRFNFNKFCEWNGDKISIIIFCAKTNKSRNVKMQLHATKKHNYHYATDKTICRIT